MTEEINTTEVLRVPIGQKPVEDEIIYRFVIVYGNDNDGYTASSEEWFKAKDRCIEFYEVLFETSIYPTIAEALIDALPSATKEAANIGKWQEKQVEEDLLPSPALDPALYEITNGYVGSLGKTYVTATEETLFDAIELAAERNNMTAEDVMGLLIGGVSVQWCDSPNYYYDHSHGIIRRKRTPKPINMVRCDCGHSVENYLVMNASRGTACPDCYDRMSE